MPKANAPPLILSAVLKGDNTTPVRSSRETLSAVPSGGNPQTLAGSLPLRYRPWRLPLGEDRTADAPTSLTLR